jgi:hypothetical protein
MNLGIQLQIMNEPNAFAMLLPLLLLGILFAIPAGLLAQSKGKNVGLWVVLALIPIVNLPSMWYFIGAPDKRIEEKLDLLLKRTGDMAT